MEDKVIENTQLNNKKKKRIVKKEDSLRKLWDNIYYNDIYIRRVPEREERDQGIENISEEIVTENFPILVKVINIQAQGAQRIPNKMNT